MKKNGFSRYNGVSDIVYIEVPGPESKSVVKSPDDVILDSIFSLNKFGWPDSSITKLLSPKTADDIRKYIQDHILVAKEANHLISDEKVISAFKDLDAEFIAAASRNRYESIEQYESRISQYIEDQRSKAATDRRIARYKEFFSQHADK